MQSCSPPGKIRRIVPPFLCLTAALLSVSSTTSRSQTVLSPPTLASFLMEENRILHGYGMDMFRWHTDAVPYIAASVNKPALYGSYIRLTEVTARNQDRLEQLTRLHEGWTDPQSGEQARMIPLIGIQAWTYDFQDRRDSLATAFFEVLGITDAAMQQFGIERPTYEMSIFTSFLAYPVLWESVRDTLVSRGLNPRDIDLPTLFSAGTDEAEYRLISLRDSALVLAADRLMERGFGFQDLAVLEGRFDDEIREIADSVKSVESPYLVRYNYENIHGVSRPVLYSKETFIAAHRHVVELFREQGANNAEFIFHPNAGNRLNIAAWYPGDEWVDWIAPSLYKSLLDDVARQALQDQHDFAVTRNKPVIIVESGPVDEEYRPHNTSYPGVWEDWFVPYFDFIRQNTNVKVFVYIGVDHGVLAGDFNDWGDTRVIVNPDLFAQWQNELTAPIYIHNKEFWTMWSSQATGIEDVPSSRAPGFDVWPNPSGGSVSIDRPTSEQPAILTIFDMMGRMVIREDIARGQRRLSWDGSTHTGVNVAPGMYIARIEDASGTSFRTIVRY